MLTDAQVREVTAMAHSLFEGLAHGDEDHRRWLYKQVYDWCFRYIEQRDK